MEHAATRTVVGVTTDETITRLSREVDDVRAEVARIMSVSADHAEKLRLLDRNADQLRRVLRAASAALVTGDATRGARSLEVTPGAPSRRNRKDTAPSR